jgi:uncharacterized repeat protein (TIGR04138 family)
MRRLFGTGADIRELGSRRWTARAFDPFDGPMGSFYSTGGRLYAIYRHETDDEELKSRHQQTLFMLTLTVGSDPAQATTILQAMLDEFPDDPALLGWYGQCLDAQHDYDKALKVLEKAHRLAPGKPAARAALFQCQKRIQELEEALRYPQILLAEDRELAQTVLKRAQVLAAQGTADKAVEMAELVVQHAADAHTRARGAALATILMMRSVAIDRGPVRSTAAQARLQNYLKLMILADKNKSHQEDVPLNVWEQAQQLGMSEDELEGMLNGIYLLLQLDVAKIHVRFAWQWISRGQYDKGRDAYRRARRVDEKDLDACNGLGWLLATCPDANVRDGLKAIEAASQACQTSKWKNPICLDTLAAAYAEFGQFERAAETERRAIALCADDRVSAYQERLKCYESAQPFHEDPNEAAAAAARAESIDVGDQDAWAEQLARSHAYPSQAFRMVRFGLKFAGWRGEQGADEDQSPPQIPLQELGAREVCDRVRSFLQRTYRSAVRPVLEHWQIRTTLDLGRIVLAIKQAGLEPLDAVESLDDFADLFDFDDAFGKYRIAAAADTPAIGSPSSSAARLKAIASRIGYPPDAVAFLYAGLSRAQREVEMDAGDQRHVSAAQLCYALRDLARETYRELAKPVLAEWGIHSTGDFGRMVYALVDAGLMSTNAEDAREGFDDVFDFDTAFPTKTEEAGPGNFA